MRRLYENDFEIEVLPLIPVDTEVRPDPGLFWWLFLPSSLFWVPVA